MIRHILQRQKPLPNVAIECPETEIKSIVIAKRLTLQFLCRLENTATHIDEDTLGVDLLSVIKLYILVAIQTFAVCWLYIYNSRSLLVI